MYATTNWTNLWSGLLCCFKTVSWSAGLKYYLSKPYLIICFQAIGWDLSSFPNIQRWHKDCSDLPGYEENEKGSQIFAEAVKKNLKQWNLQYEFYEDNYYLSLFFNIQLFSTRELKCL